MSVKGKKFSVKRELKTAMPKPLLRRLNKVLEEYGAGQALASETGITYNTIAAAVKSGLATQSTIIALNRALNQVAA